MKKKLWATLLALAAALCLVLGLAACAPDQAGGSGGSNGGSNGGSGGSGSEDPGPTPAAATVEGYWTGSDLQDSTLTAAVKLVDDKAYAVIVMEQDTRIYYRAKIFDKQEDGSYRLEEQTGSGTLVYTGKLNADNNLVVTMPGSFVGQSDDATVTFSEKQELPAALTISGPYHPADFPLEFNFTTHEVKQSGVVIDGVQFVNVGNYIMIVAPTPGTSEVTLLIVFQKEGTYYYVGGLSQPVALTAGQPA